MLAIYPNSKCYISAIASIVNFVQQNHFYLLVNIKALRLLELILLDNKYLRFLPVLHAMLSVLPIQQNHKSKGGKSKKNSDSSYIKVIISSIQMADVTSFITHYNILFQTKVDLRMFQPQNQASVYFLQSVSFYHWLSHLSSPSLLVISDSPLRW